MTESHITGRLFAVDNTPHPVHESLLIQKLLSKMPPDVAASFSEEQLIAMNKAIGGPDINWMSGAQSIYGGRVSTL